MILPLPEKFDANELWVLFGTLLLAVIFFKLPKHFPAVLTFIILLFTGVLSITVDYLLAANYPFNFYDAMDTEKYDLFDFIMDIINYSLYGYLFFYFYDKYNPKGIYLVLYFVYWIAQSLVLEWISIKLNVFHFINWSLYYSAFAYLIIFILYILFLRLSKLAMNQVSD